MPSHADLMQIGQTIIDLNDQDKGRDAVAQLYTKDAVSAEAMAVEGQDSNEVQGVEAIYAKHDFWESANEVHSTSAEGPFPHGSDRFCVIYEMDTTHKASGERTQMKEVATYFVNEDNKIYREEFAYALE